MNGSKLFYLRSLSECVCVCAWLGRPTFSEPPDHVTCNPYLWGHVLLFGFVRTNLEALFVVKWAVRNQ